MTYEKVSWRERLAPQATLALIMGIVVVYDLCCKKGNTLSEEIDRLRESPHTGKYTHLALDALYDHLKRNREPEDDPIHRLARYFGKD